MVNEKHLFIIVGVLVLGFVGFMMADSANRNKQVSGEGMPIGDASVKEFSITAKRFSFEPSTITVNQGDKVRLTLKSTDTTHGIAISEFNVNLVAGAGEQKTVEFVADKEGIFNFA